MSKRVVPRLSKNLLEMKFMQKSKEKVQIENLENEKKISFDKEAIEAMEKVGSYFIVEPSYGPCEDLLFGRMSFRGANPEIEKLMKDAAILKKEKEIEYIEDKGTVSVEEMANRYTTLIGTMGKKFTSKRQRTKSSREGDNGGEAQHSDTPPKKKKFIKPTDD